MTNAQRDELLISMAKGLNNLQESLNDTRKELKAEIKQSAEDTKAILREEIKQSAEDTKAILREEIKQSAEDTKATLRNELTQSIGNLRSEFTQALKNTEDKLIDKIEAESRATAEVFKDHRAYELRKRQALTNQIIELRKKFDM